MMDPAVKSEIEAIIASHGGLLARWQKVQQKLVEKGLAWYATLTCDQLAVHPSNRGGSGVQPYEVHRKGEAIVNNGACEALLGSSVCIELSPKVSQRDAQVTFNKNLVTASEGLLAWTSKERFATVAKSHTSQFMKAIMAGCKTTSSCGVNGILNQQSLTQRDEQLKRMIETGWDWLVISWSVEEELPQLPSFAALALNSTNSSFEAVSELELASHLTVEATRETEVNWDQISTTICNSGTVAHYAKTIGQYVKLYSGGCGFPLVHFLVNFAKTHAASVALGKEYWQAVTHTQLHQNFLMPFARLSLLCANLAAPEEKVVDGYARLLFKGDVERMKSKKFAGHLLELEELFQKCWKDCMDLEEYVKARIFGKLCVRACLASLGKGKQGPEHKELTLQQCKDLFYENKRKNDAQRLQAEPKAEPPGTPKGNKPVSLQQSKDPMFIAELKVPLLVGTFYVHKDYEGKVWTLVSKGLDSCELSYQDLVTGHEKKLEIPAGDIVSKLKQTKVKAPKLVSPSVLANGFLNVNAELECQKASIYMQLLDAYQTLDTDENFIKVIYQPGKGYTMYAACNMKKHALVLIPCTDQVSKIVMEKPKAKEFGSIQLKGSEVYVLPPKILKEGEHGWEGAFCPFFVCKNTSAEGNMQETTIKHKELQIKALQNFKAIAKNEEICIYAAPEDDLNKSHQSNPSKKRKH